MHIAPSEAVHTHYAASLSLHSLRQRGMGPPKRSQVLKVLERAATHCAQESCDTPTPLNRLAGHCNTQETSHKSAPAQVVVRPFPLSPAQLCTPRCSPAALERPSALLQNGAGLGSWQSQRREDDLNMQMPLGGYSHSKGPRLTTDSYPFLQHSGRPG